ncbi:MAG: tetratricopeptide repeat protein, partial [Syntrophaceae bacterium]|nr:tetratricopeptide repeat protein [Syntrophaceae bacterium]
RKKILIPAGATVIIILAVLAWRQCGYWKNKFELFKHACLVTKNNYLAHNDVASMLAEKGKFKEAIDNYNMAISARPDLHLPYIGRGLVYEKLGQYHRSIEDYNQAIYLKPDYAETYFNRGNSYDELGYYQQAIENYNEAIRLNPDYVQAYNNRGNTYFSKGDNELGCRDAQKACELGNCQLLEFARNKKYCR